MIKVAINNTRSILPFTARAIYSIKLQWLRLSRVLDSCVSLDLESRFSGITGIDPFSFPKRRDSVGFTIRRVVKPNSETWQFGIGIRETNIASATIQRVWLTFMCLGIVAFVSDGLRGGYKRSRATICRCALSRNGGRAYASRWDIKPIYYRSWRT